MYLKKTPENDFLQPPSWFESFLRNRQVWVLGLFFYSFALLLEGASLGHGKFLEETFGPFLKGETGRIFRNQLSGLFAFPERLAIDVKQLDYLKLAAKRQEALAIGLLVKETGDEVTAQLRYRDQAVRVDLRLKGDWTDHLEDREKWSFRIRVKGADTLFGIKRFSLQHPKTRNYLNEWFFHRTLKREGILSLKYEFIQVALNGKNLGIYALEEHFDKYLIEGSQKMEGPILRFDEALTWENIAHFGTIEHLKELSVSVLPITAHNENQTLGSPVLKENFLRAAHLLEEVRQGKLPYSKVLDLPLFGRYFALLDLLGGQHNASQANLRFYYNPITGLLEPIGFDADAGTPISALGGETLALDPEDDLNLIALWKDEGLWEVYLKELERISRKEYLDELFTHLEPEIQKNLRLLHRDYPGYNFSKDVFYRNQDYIRKALDPIKGAHGYFVREDQGKIEMKLANILSVPLEITGLSFQGTKITSLKKILLQPRLRLSKLEFKDAVFEIPEGMAWSDTMLSGLMLRYRLPGTREERENLVFPWSHLDGPAFDEDLTKQTPNMSQFDFLLVDETRRRIVIQPGNWNVDRTLVLAPGYTVWAEEGTRLNLSRSAKVISYSPLIFRGSEEKPIFIESADSTGQGVLVLKAQAGSLLENVVFKNLSNPSEGLWSLRGAVTFYESPVRLRNCQFVRSRAEDALNITRSTFVLQNSQFIENERDAFDGDFIEGRVLNTVFVKSGNDAIDLSGSRVGIRGVTIREAGDKGISVGEGSFLKAQQVSIEKAEIGVASKDLSLADLDGIEIKDCKVGFTVYQKKTEFGPGSLSFYNFHFSNVEKPYMVEKGSQLRADGYPIEGSYENEKSLFYGTTYGKASR